MASSAHSLVGQRVFGGYSITRKLGEGGMGAVYIAENRELNKKLAVKILLPEWSQNEQIVERFLAEARAASAIQHPNIIDIIDASQLPDGSNYILMEYLEGGSLREFAQRWGALAVDMALAITLQVCSALDATHMRGIVHRDLKPANLMVSPTQTNQLFTKVLDFGIAKLNDARLAGNIKTGTNAVAGTPSYMSPEQARATRDVDHRADIYSLGVIVYELLAGTRPYTAESIGELAYQQATTDPILLSKHRPDLPKAWCQIVQSCIAVEPEHRPQNMRELAHALIAATANGKHIATSVAPLLFTNAPRNANTFKYHGDYGIGVAPSAPKPRAASNSASGAVSGAVSNAASGAVSGAVSNAISGSVSGDQHLASAHTVAAGASHSQRASTGPAVASVAVDHTLSAMPVSESPVSQSPVSASPNTTLSAIASQSSIELKPTTSKRAVWVIPAMIAATAVVAGITFTIVQATKTTSANEAVATSAPPPLDAQTPAPEQVDVRIDTTPPGATIYVDDVKRGVTRVAMSIAAGQTINVRAEKSGHVTVQQPLHVTPTTNTLRLTLVATPPQPLSAELRKTQQQQIQQQLVLCARRYNATGKWSVRVRVQTTGIVTSARSLRGPSRRAGACMAKRWRATRFPRLSKAATFVSAVRVRGRSHRPRTASTTKPAGTTAKPTTVAKPGEEPTTVAKPSEKPTTVAKPIEKPTTVAKPTDKPATVTRPTVTKPKITKPATKETFDPNGPAGDKTPKKERDFNGPAG